MGDIIIQTIKDLLTNEQTIINHRYAGDFEFQEFKKHLHWKRDLLIIINLFILYLATTFLVIQAIYVFFVPIQVITIICSGVSLILLGLLLFALHNLYVLIYVDYRHFELRKIKIQNISISWNKWQFKDIIFNKVISLRNTEQIQYTILNNSKYIIYFILQYPDGSFGWYAITNIQELMNNKNIINSSERDKDKNLTHLEWKILNENKSVTIWINDIIKMRKETIYFNDKNEPKPFYITPMSILGIRIRSSINNECVKIKNLKII